MLYYDYKQIFTAYVHILEQTFVWWYLEHELNKEITEIFTLIYCQYYQLLAYITGTCYTSYPPSEQFCYP